MHSNRSKAPKVLLSTIAALGLAMMPLLTSLGGPTGVYAASMRIQHQGGDGVRVTEGSSTGDTFDVDLDSQPDSNVVINVVNQNPSQINVSPSAMTFTPENWQQDQRITVTAVDDSSSEGTHTATVTLRVQSSSDPDFPEGMDEDIAVTITDNEAGSVGMTTSRNSVTVSESGSSQDFTVVLNRQPASGTVVVLNVTSDDTGEATVTSPSNGKLTFTSDNWNQPQTVRVTGMDDSDMDGSQNSEITLSVDDAATTDDSFDSVADTEIDVTTSDNEAVTRVQPTPLTPAQNTKLSGLGTTLTWTQEPGAQWHQLQVVPFGSDGPGIDLVIGDPDRVAAASYTVEDPDFGSSEPNYVMLPDMTYMWRVRTALTSTQPANGDWSNWSTEARFETGNKSSSTISLMAPNTSGTMISSLRPTLQWSNTDDDVFYYEVQVSKNSSFCASAGCPMLYWELRHGGVTNPANSYTIPSGFPLEDGETYFWRVRPRIQGDGTPVAWSATGSFRTP